MMKQLVNNQDYPRQTRIEIYKPESHIDTKQQIKTRVVDTIMSKFYRDTWGDTRIALNWPVYEKGNIISQVRKLLETGIDFYYIWYKLNYKEKKLLESSDFETRYENVRKMLDSVDRLIKQEYSIYFSYNNVFKLALLMVLSLKVNYKTSFTEQFSRFIVKILNDDLSKPGCTTEDVPIDELFKTLKEVKAALTIVGALFAIEYAERKNTAKEKWEKAALFFIEFYKEIGYVGVAEAIENEYFGDDLNRWKRIKEELSIDSHTISTIKRSIKGTEGVLKVSSRMKSLISIQKKTKRKEIEFNIDAIRDNIRDINGIKIVLSDGKYIGVVMNRIVNILKNHKMDIKNIEVEYHGYDPTELIYNWSEDVTIKHSKKHHDYKAIHVTLAIDNKSSKKYMEIQLVLGEEQYYRNQYARGVSHISYKLGNLDYTFGELTAELFRQKVFRIKIADDLIDMQDMEIVNNKDEIKIISINNSIGKKIILIIKDLYALGLNVLSPKHLEEENRLIIEPRIKYRSHNTIVAEI